MCSSGSAATSRRVSRIQATRQTIVMIPPMIERIQPIVVPTTISVIPIAVAKGMNVGAGRWISSPAGGAPGSRSFTRAPRSSGGCSRMDVDRGCQERHAEHEQAGGAGDQTRADVLACELSIHDWSGDRKSVV